MCGEAETLLQSLGTAGFSACTVLVLGGTAEQGIVAHICKPKHSQEWERAAEKKKKGNWAKGVRRRKMKIMYESFILALRI